MFGSEMRGRTGGFLAVWFLGKIKAYRYIDREIFCKSFLIGNWHLEIGLSLLK